MTFFFWDVGNLEEQGFVGIKYFLYVRGCDFCFLICRWYFLVFLIWLDLWFFGVDLIVVGFQGEGIELGLQLLDVFGLI